LEKRFAIVEVDKFAEEFPCFTLLVPFEHFTHSLGDVLLDEGIVLIVGIQIIVPTGQCQLLHHCQLLLLRSFALFSLELFVSLKVLDHSFRASLNEKKVKAVSELLNRVT